MKKHLRLRGAHPGSLEIFDLGYPGLALRVGHGGAKSVEQFYRIGGKLKTRVAWSMAVYQLGCGSRGMAQDSRSYRRRVNFSDSASVAAPLLELESVEWSRRDQARNRASTLYEVTRTVEANLLPAWRGRPIDKITKADVVELIDSVCDRGAVTPADRALRRGLRS